MRQVKVILPYAEFRALFEMANRDLRTPNDQIVWLIRREAARRGLFDELATKEYDDAEAKSH